MGKMAVNVLNTLNKDFGHNLFDLLSKPNAQCCITNTALVCSLEKERTLFNFNLIKMVIKR